MIHKKVNKNIEESYTCVTKKLPHKIFAYYKENLN